MQEGYPRTMFQKIMLQRGAGRQKTASLE